MLNREKERTDRLLALIRRVEAGGNYNATFGHADAVADLGFLTVEEVMEKQTMILAGGSKSSAIGAYQFLQKTLLDLVHAGIVDEDDFFTPGIQDRLARELLRRRGWDRYLAGQISAETIQRSLSMEWASLPKDATDKSFYAGDGLNKALVSTEELQKAIA
jgi:muramidase (phage lysozyme)